jgi:hypothetical protein
MLRLIFSNKNLLIKISLAVVVFLILILLLTFIVREKKFAPPSPAITQNVAPTTKSAPLESVKKATQPIIIPQPHQSRMHVFTYSFSLAGQATKKLLNMVDLTIHHLRHNRYKLGGTYFNSSSGVYTIDCSNYVDHLLRTADPGAYWNLKTQTRCYTPTSKDYYAFFTELSPDKAKHDWLRIEQVKNLVAGDILVFRYKHLSDRRAAGHVMVIMAQPKNLHKQRNVYLVRVSDSAPTRHSNDTRPPHTSGIGIGTLLLKTDSKGKPYAYAWKEGAPWEYDMYFAMARLASPKPHK